jgi:hypothetical protein
MCVLAQDLFAQPVKFHMASCGHVLDDTGGTVPSREILLGRRTPEINQITGGIVMEFTRSRGVGSQRTPYARNGRSLNDALQRNLAYAAHVATIHEDAVGVRRVHIRQHGGLRAKTRLVRSGSVVGDKGVAAEDCLRQQLRKRYRDALACELILYAVHSMA